MGSYPGTGQTKICLKVRWKNSRKCLKSTEFLGQSGVHLIMNTVQNTLKTTINHRYQNFSYITFKRSIFQTFWKPHCVTKSLFFKIEHTVIYSRNNMRQKCGGNCGLWILHEIIQNEYSENLRKIVGALWELPAN